MEIGTIIAVGGTLVGTFGGALLSYFISKKLAERHRRWALEDERRRTKNELLDSRLKHIEEALLSMMARIDHAVYSEIGVPVKIDDSTRKQREQETREKLSNAWTAVYLIGSEELNKKFGILTNVYWESVEEETLDPEEGKKAQNAQLDIIRLIDKIRLEV